MNGELLALGCLACYKHSHHNQPINAMTSPNTSKWARAKLHIRQVATLSLPYFQSEQRWLARGLLAASIGLNLAMVYLLVQLNEWSRVFYDSLQNKNAEVFWHQMLVFTGLAFAYILIAVYRFFLTQSLEMRWRSWMTSDLLGRWMKDGALYQLELNANATGSTNPSDNPDQRIQEDVQQFTADTVSLSLGLLESLVTLCSFVGILWGLSGEFTFRFLGSTWYIDGFMVWMALAYSAAGSIAGHFIGRALYPLNMAQQRLEADFRHHLIRDRENSEAIALERGENFEADALKARFAKVAENFWARLRAQKRYTAFNSGYGQAAVVFPYLVAAPRFFSGAIKLGDMMQVASAFGRVQDSMSWIVSNYMGLSSWMATTTRLISLHERLAEIERATGALRSENNAPWATSLRVERPDGTLLIEADRLEGAAGQSILLSGPSGCGKSTLFRSIAGIWPHAQSMSGRGRQRFAPESSMFIPQRPHFPVGTLRSALCYPGPCDLDESSLVHALNKALLPNLATKLDESCDWSSRLSGGEKQRLAIARAFARQPAWIFADEATSALDDLSERKLLAELKDAAAARGGALICISHRPDALAWHDVQWDFAPHPDKPGASELRCRKVEPI